MFWMLLICYFYVDVFLFVQFTFIFASEAFSVERFFLLYDFDP